MKSNKAQGLPLNTIVIAAIVLIVMVVLIYIFVGGMGQTTQKLQSCTEKGGTCMGSINCDGTGDQVSIGKTKDCEGTTDDHNHPTLYCCVPLVKE